MDQKRVGILISYLNMGLGIISNVFLIPLMISSLGDLDYSVYKVMQSFAGPLSMFHLGISTIVTRAVVRQHHDECTEREKKNTLALSILASAVISLFVLVSGCIMYSLIPGIYGKTYDAASIATGRRVFLILVFSTVFHMMTDAFSGCLNGHEKFAISSGIIFSKSLLRIVLLFVFLNLKLGVIAVTMVDLTASILMLIVTIAYASIVLKEIPHLYYFDKRQIIEILSFGAAILLQAFVNQVNNNVDTMILGAMVNEKRIITMYSSALAIYAVYNSLISAITNFFLPKATRLVSQNASGEELTDFVIRPGRFQAIIAVACIFGFFLFGRNFIYIWIGRQYADAYWITLMLIIPVTIPLVENAAISILDASLKRMYRSVVLVVMAVLNVILSVILVRFLGFWGTAIGTITSLIVGHGFLMNIYYQKTFHMEIGRMFCSIFKGILPAGLVAALLCFPVSLFLDDTIVFFIVKCTVYLIIYAALLWLFGLNQGEKGKIRGMMSLRFQP